MPGVKRIPLRKCSGCNEQKPKNELVRVVRTPEGEIRLDLTGKLSGRGAYICRDTACLRRARKAKRFEKAFEAAVPDSVFDEIEKELSALG